MSTGRDLAVSVLDGEALPIVEAVPVDREFYDFDARYEIGRTEFEVPGRADRRRAPRARRSSRVRAYELLGCSGFARVDLLVRPRRPASCSCSRSTRCPA